jgi:hypothetical protein
MLVLDRNNPEALRTRGKVLGDLGGDFLTQSEEDLSAAIREEPDEPDGYRCRGLTRFRAEKWSGAVASRMFPALVCATCSPSIQIPIATTLWLVKPMAGVDDGLQLNQMLIDVHNLNGHLIWSVGIIHHNCLQAWGQDREPFLGALAGADVKDHASRIDVRNLQTADLAQT